MSLKGHQKGFKSLKRKDTRTETSPRTPFFYNFFRRCCCLKLISVYLQGGPSVEFFNQRSSNTHVWKSMTKRFPPPETKTLLLHVCSVNPEFLQFLCPSSPVSISEASTLSPLYEPRWPPQASTDASAALLPGEARQHSTALCGGSIS